MTFREIGDVNEPAAIFPPWADYKSASAYCGLGRTTLWRLRNEGLIESAKEGKRVLIFLPSLDDYLHGRARGGQTVRPDNRFRGNRTGGPENGWPIPLPNCPVSPKGMKTDSTRRIPMISAIHDASNSPTPTRVVNVDLCGTVDCAGRGSGKWQVLVHDDADPYLIEGTEENTTHVRMTMRAAIEALRPFSEPRSIVARTSLGFLVQAMKEEWWARWSRNGWRKKTGGPVANRDLWEELLKHTHIHEIEWR